jgi:hypothetical protein
MSNGGDYPKDCNTCGNRILMSQRSGKWSAYEADNSLHKCKGQQQGTQQKTVVVEQAKQPANKLPPEMRPTRARFALIEHELQHVAVNMLTEYVNKYRDYGGQTFGVTYHYRKEDGYTVFFVSHDIPNAAVAEIESV